jgi:hypothetical protein
MELAGLRRRTNSGDSEDSEQEGMSLKGIRDAAVAGAG